MTNRPAPLPGHVGRKESPRDVLERHLLPAITAGPCYVMFSGGRDSSTLLAVATALARRLDADDPVPVTVVHADAPRADESDWQELVLHHLGIRRRIVLSASGDQTLLSPHAKGALRRHGAVWPEALQLQGFTYGQLDAGFVVTGEGGDDVLGDRRLASLRRVWRRRRLRRSDARALVSDLAPRAVRRRAQIRWLSASDQFSWLREPYRAQAISQFARAAVAEQLPWNRAVRKTLSRDAYQVLKPNFEASVREYGHVPVNPYLETSFAAALSREGGPLGIGDRTGMMRYLFADLLPDAVLARRSKASFNETRWGKAEREFAAAWNGSGFGDAVDPAALRAAWLADNPPSMTDFMLHVAWLASPEADG